MVRASAGSCTHLQAGGAAGSGALRCATWYLSGAADLTMPAVPASFLPACKVTGSPEAQA